MSAFADASALVKLYADEPGHAPVRALDALVVAAISRVEVPAALWRKHRMGELAADDARLLASAFAADATERFAVVALGGRVLELGARLVAVHPLRAYDAVQLAAALAARDADPDCDRFACFDGRLRDAAAAEGFALVP